MKIFNWLITFIQKIWSKDRMLMSYIIGYAKEEASNIIKGLEEDYEISIRPSKEQELMRYMAYCVENGMVERKYQDEMHNQVEKIFAYILNENLLLLSRYESFNSSMKRRFNVGLKQIVAKLRENDII